jgi:inhibitor of KinA
MNHLPEYKIYSSGDNALTVELGNTMDEAVNQKVLSVFHYVQDTPVLGIKEIIPAYGSLTIVYDVMVIRENYPSAFQFIRQQIETALRDCDMDGASPAKVIEIPVCYDISMGIDLNEIAAQKQLTTGEIIQLHTHTSYHVYMIGFLPGFAYMGPVDEKIATPRKVQPRTKVMAGSVGIAGRQTGIYPLDSPVKLFDPEREMPVFLEAGDTIKFFPITPKEFNEIKNKQ